MKFSLPEILRSALILGIDIAVGKFWPAGTAGSGGEQKGIVPSSPGLASQSTPSGQAAPAAAEVFSRLKHADKKAAGDFLTANASQPWRDDDSYVKYVANWAKTAPAAALE